MSKQKKKQQKAARDEEDDALDKLLDAAISDAPDKIQEIKEPEPELPQPIIPLSMDNIVFTASRSDNPQVNSDEVKPENVNDKRKPIIRMSRMALMRAKRRRTIIFLPK